MRPEWFDILDCAGNPTGKQVERDEAHGSGIWHGAFHCLIVYRREGNHYALFQKRSPEKKVAPGRFDVSVGGHYSAGEGPSAAGPREIREEIGLEVEFADLVPLGRRVALYCFEQGVRECEFQDVYLLHRSIRPADLKLQAGEVEAVLELEVRLGIELHAGERGTAGGLLFTGQGRQERVSVTAADFVPSLDSYYLKLLLIAQRYLAGARDHLVI